MIQTPEDFCQWLQPDASIRSVQKSLYWLLSLRSARKKRREYQIFWLAKRGGGYRPVAAPSPGLKKVQHSFAVVCGGSLSPCDRLSAGLHAFAQCGPACRATLRGQARHR